MKIRNGFVSNSSSSSFTVTDISYGFSKLNVSKNHTYVIGRKGEVEFGWGPSRINDINSRVSWAFLQAECLNETFLKGVERSQYFSNKILKSMGDNNSIKMLYNLLISQKNISNIKIIITKSWDDSDDSERWGYIDHQSCAYEDSNNGSIFDSMKSLKDFIFGSKSYIELDNDNH